MLPRALLVLLAVMNIAVALWWVAQSTAPVTASVADTPVGVPELRLPLPGEPALLDLRAALGALQAQPVACD